MVRKSAYWIALSVVAAAFPADEQFAGFPLVRTMCGHWRAARAGERALQDRGLYQGDSGRHAASGGAGEGVGAVGERVVGRRSWRPMPRLDRDSGAPTA